MAITRQLQADITGTIGKVVVYPFMGKTVVRSMPAKKQAPATGAQKKVQDDFARVMKIMQAVKEFVKVGFRDVAEGRTAFQEALSVNLKRHRQSDDPRSLHWLVVSRGERAGAVGLKVRCEGSRAVISWDAVPAGAFSSLDDVVMLLALNTVTLACSYTLEASSRCTGEASLDLPAALPQEQLLVFITFRSKYPGGKKRERNVAESQVVIVNC
jgi:hypothetical protein